LPIALRITAYPWKADELLTENMSLTSGELWKAAFSF
jgi:hypothetical protein